MICIFVSFIVVVSSYDYTKCEFPSTTKQRVEWLDEILVNTQQILTKHNVITWAVQSTLLGIVRDKKTMPWTWDVDMQTFVNNISTICQNTSKAHQELLAQGYRIFDCFHHFARVCKAKFTNLNNIITTGEPVESRLDIYAATPLSDGLYKVTFSPCKWDLDKYLFPLKNYTWLDKSILGPNNYDYFLEMSYGSNWTIPVRYGGGIDDLCTYKNNPKHRFLTNPL